VLAGASMVHRQRIEDGTPTGGARLVDRTLPAEFTAALANSSSGHRLAMYGDKYNARAAVGSFAHQAFPGRMHSRVADQMCDHAQSFTESAEIGAFQATQHIYQQPGIRAGCPQQKALALGRYVQAHDPRIVLIPCALHELALDERIDQIARCRLVQGHPLGKIVDTHAAGASDLGERPQLRAGNSHDMPHLGIVMPGRGKDRAEFLKGRELQTIPLATSRGPARRTLAGRSSDRAGLALQSMGRGRRHQRAPMPKANAMCERTRLVIVHGRKRDRASICANVVC